MAMEHEGKKEGSGGLGIGLGVDINLRLTQVRELVSTLNSALSETTSNLTGILSDVANKIREFGPDKFKSEAKEGGYEEEYDKLVYDLREAANRGEEEARNLLGEMGEKVESAGESMKEAGREDPH